MNLCRNTNLVTLWYADFSVFVNISKRRYLHTIAKLRIIHLQFHNKSVIITDFIIFIK